MRVYMCMCVCVRMYVCMYDRVSVRVRVRVNGLVGLGVRVSYRSDPYAVCMGVWV